MQMKHECDQNAHVYLDGKDRERARISGGECMIIAHKLPRNTAPVPP